MKRLLLQGLLAFLLLAGQHSALVHSVWHLRDHLPAHEQHDQSRAAAQDHEDEHSSQSRLCDLHAALGAVLAGDCGGTPAFVAAPAAEFVAPGNLAGRVPHHAVTPPSRAPPALS